MSAAGTRQWGSPRSHAKDEPSMISVPGRSSTLRRASAASAEADMLGKRCWKAQKGGKAREEQRKRL